ncbi:uncharacterized protein MONOS_13443 [Monocercomonoides exilis]|uniref:uncharacterized protein n=1 Tax=Monocercomonoides exilis TaxID=2049356 RepID=UPI003559ECBD|nr:hypothetical protein MONOS_13443 [Monocercomonoides exilis]|eukprot:MONOS_13443.1-p1 / transcript=MONOS_13443.1 / gene=MONOS_13443 / organism=Monocercomonoides_exilis_PA203 / gene_product=F5 / transcript_product=F5 / location=Mono_scaffold00829:25111-25836(-) / protein_length=148 / sequence_SO=supercontig / SO=protein_coding / is_pseudo=false
MKNWILKENGGSIVEFSSQYHHESRCLNLLTRDPTLCWFSGRSPAVPQHVIFSFSTKVDLKRVGIYLHGESNQNPKYLIIQTSLDGKNFTTVAESELEQRAGDHLFDLPELVTASFIKFIITENFGGSGIFVTKALAFGEESMDHTRS